MAEKGMPWASRLGVATETTGVVRFWASWAPAASRWAFCRRGAAEGERERERERERDPVSHRTTRSSIAHHRLCW